MRCCDDRWNPSTRRQALLLRRLGPLFTQGGRLVNRSALRYQSRQRRPTQGRCVSEDVVHHDHPLRPRQSVHLVGVQRERPAPRAHRLDGDHGGLLRQRPDGVVLGNDADRAPRSTEGRTIVELASAIADYIDNFYNPARRHSSLDYLTPNEFEDLNSPQPQATCHNRGPLNGVKGYWWAVVTPIRTWLQIDHGSSNCQLCSPIASKGRPQARMCVTTSQSQK
jgi:hypothetical protein